MELKNIVEAMLFASPRPLTSAEVATAIRKAAQAEDDPVPEYAKVKEQDIEAVIEMIEAETEGRGFFLQKVNGGFRFTSREEYSKWVAYLLNAPKPPRLSPAALETLAVIAYRQPISRAEIEAIRGVAVGGVVETLIERSVVRVAGRADVPGRPLLYETTDHFLEHFGLNDTAELPNVEELKRVKLPEPETEEVPEQQELIPDGDDAAKDSDQETAEEAGEEPDSEQGSTAETSASSEEHSEEPAGEPQENDSENSTEESEEEVEAADKEMTNDSKEPQKNEEDES